MKPQAIANPPNPWASTEVEYLEEIPPSRSSRSEDHASREILAQNDSPDVGFTLEREPVPRLPARLRVLLRAARRTST